MQTSSTYQVNFSSEVMEFLAGLDKKEQAFCSRQIELLQQFGPSLTFPHVRHVKDKIWELRIRCNKKIFRMFYIIEGQGQINIYYGFHKTSEQIPQQVMRLITEKAK